MAFPPNLPGFAVYLIRSVYLSYSACSAFSLVSASPNRQHRPHNRCRDREVDINNCLCSIAEHRQNRRQDPGALFPFFAHLHAGAAQKRKIRYKRKRSHCNKVLKIFVVGALIENSIPIQRILPEIPSQNSICVGSKTKQLMQERQLAIGLPANSPAISPVRSPVIIKTRYWDNALYRSACPPRFAS